MLSQRTKLVVLIIAFLLLIVELFMLDYEQLWSRDNLGMGLQILANILIIASMLVSIRHTIKTDNEKGESLDKNYDNEI